MLHRSCSRTGLTRFCFVGANLRKSTGFGAFVGIETCGDNRLHTRKRWGKCPGNLGTSRCLKCLCLERIPDFMFLKSTTIQQFSEMDLSEDLGYGSRTWLISTPDMRNMHMRSECHSSRWILVSDEPATGVGTAAWARCHVRWCTFSTPNDAGIYGASRERDSGQEGKKRPSGLAGYFPGPSTIVLFIHGLLRKL